MGGNDFKTKSSLSPAQEPVAKAMFEIFKSNLSSGLPRYPGSQAVPGFAPGAVQRTFQARIGGPMGQLWQKQFAPLIGPAASGYAETRRGETINALSARAGRVGEQQAYQEWLRTRPSGLPMDLGQAMLSQSYTGSYLQPGRGAQAAQLGLTALSAAGAAYAGSQQPGVSPSPWGGGNQALDPLASPWWSDRYGAGTNPLPYTLWE